MKTSEVSELIKIADLNKSFLVGNQRVQILKNISFSVPKSDFLVIFGPSGCGKSTLLHAILGLEPPSSGSIIFLNKWLYTNTSEDDRSEFRKNHIGMVYQQPNWIKSLNVIENTAFPLALLGVPEDQRIQKAYDFLSKVNMQNWAKYTPTELSSGQQQKVALARALITNPEVIIADEPTGNLDFESGQELMSLLSELNEKQGKTIIMVTHDLEYVRFAKTAVRMLDGEIMEILNDSKSILDSVNYKRMSIKK